MPKYVTRESLTDRIYNELNISRKDAGHIVDCVFQEMSEALAQEGKVDISGFGKFYVFDRKERMGINPVTKEKMLIHATKLPKFRPSKTLKALCNK